MYLLKDLDLHEQMNIHGGAPGTDTSFAYDLFYYAIRLGQSWIKAGKMMNECESCGMFPK
jgi:hypothetical protein